MHAYYCLLHVFARSFSPVQVRCWRRPTAPALGLHLLWVGKSVDVKKGKRTVVQCFLISILHTRDTASKCTFPSCFDQAAALQLCM